MSELDIRPASERDVPGILALLTAQHLPVDGLTDHLHTTLVAKDAGRVVGSVAIEVYDDGGLLRSVAVDDALKGQGVGRALTAAAFQMAREQGLRTLFLLTTTAENYFPKFGFERIQRADVPVSVRASVEFTSACPASAVVMRLSLS